jgi:hypothetical protein
MSEPAVDTLVHRAEDPRDHGGPENGVGKGFQKIQKSDGPDHQDREKNILSNFLHFHGNLRTSEC